MGRCVGPPDPRPIPHGLTSQESSKPEWRGGGGDLGPRRFLSWYLMENSFIGYMFQANPHSILSFSQCQHALAITKGKKTPAQICSEGGLIMSICLLWNLINVLVFRDPSEQCVPVSWARSPVKRAYSGETNVSTRPAHFSLALSAFKENAIMNLSLYRNLPTFHTYAHLALFKFFFFWGGGQPSQCVSDAVAQSCSLGMLTLIP